MIKKILFCAFVVMVGGCIAGRFLAALVMELRPQDFTGIRWYIGQGSLSDNNPNTAYFVTSGTPKYISNVAGTGYSGISINSSVWGQCRGFGGPISPLNITGTNPRTIEVWTFNPTLSTEETLVDLSHKCDEFWTHFTFENGKNWAFNGNAVSGAIIGIKHKTRTYDGLALSATADADGYALADSSEHYNVPLLTNENYYLAAWKDCFIPSDDVFLNADIPETLNFVLSVQAGRNLASGRTLESGRVYASTISLEKTANINGAFDGQQSSFLAWDPDTAQPRELVVDISDQSGNHQKINSVTFTTNKGCVCDFELWDETRAYELIVHSSAAPVTVGSAKSQPDGSLIELIGKCVTYAPRDKNGQRSTDYYYVEDLNRTSGIRIHNTSSGTDDLRVNDVVTISGTLLTDAATGESYVEAVPPTGTAGMGLLPYYMTTKSLQENPHAVGMLIKTMGKVKEVATDGSWFIISDGYHINKADEGTKVYVSGAQLPANIASPSEMIIVTGVVSRENTASGTRSIILMLNYNIVTSESSPGITFFAASDLHYGDSDTIDAANHATIDCLNALPGTEYPSEIGGIVGNPSGIVLVGDITESATTSDLKAFSSDYGVNGECRLRYPVFEGLGNHDDTSTGIVAECIRARNMLRRGLSNISDNGIHYSWDWGNVHFVNCNNVPTDITGGDPVYALQFLKDDLLESVGNSGRPVVIFHHVNPGNSGWSSSVWNNYYNTIKNYNVVAIIHGHTHAIGHYTWNGIDVFQDGATQYDPYPGRFLVFQITDNRLSAAVMYYDRSQQTWNFTQHWTKAISTPSSTSSLVSLSSASASAE